MKCCFPAIVNTAFARGTQRTILFGGTAEAPLLQPCLFQGLAPTRSISSAETQPTPSTLAKDHSTYGIYPAIAMDHDNPTRRRGRPPKFRGSDCHTCIQQRRKCDGARPCCKNCQRSGIICGGFKIQLFWQPGFSTHRKPTKRLKICKSPGASSPEFIGARQLEFVEEHPGAVAVRPSKPSEQLALSCNSHSQIPANVLYNGMFDRFESIFDRCRSSVFHMTRVERLC